MISIKKLIYSITLSYLLSTTKMRISLNLENPPLSIPFGIIFSKILKNSFLNEPFERISRIVNDLSLFPVKEVLLVEFPLKPNRIYIYRLLTISLSDLKMLKKFNYSKSEIHASTSPAKHLIIIFMKALYS